MASNTEFLDIAIIGAGIAGLAAGICLRRAGRSVTIYERSEFKNEVGAAIFMGAHAVRILREWGIASADLIDGDTYTDTARGTKLKGSQTRDSKTAKVTSKNSYDGDEQTFGARNTSYHRADLHNALRKVAMEMGAKIVLGQTATDIDCEAGKATLTDTATKTKSQTIQANLIVLADGIRSPFVQKVTHQDIPLVHLGLSCYRMLISTKDLQADPETAIFLQDDGQQMSARTRSTETGVFLITYPCRNSEVLNIALFKKRAQSDNDNGEIDWNTPATAADAAAALEGFHPAYKAVLKHADAVKIYSLSDRAPLPTYVNGRVVLIGDAAHPMLPTLAGGGTTSLEDAAALEVLMKGVDASDKNQLQQRLALFDALRRPRDSMTQVLSQGLLSPRPAIQLADKVRDYYAGHLPEVVIAGSNKDAREFIYTYDVYDVTEKALAWAEKEGFPSDMMLRLQKEGVVKHFGR